MDPSIRYVFAIIGALLGLWLSSTSAAFWDLLVGAAVGFAIGEVRLLRSELAEVKRRAASQETPRPRAQTPVPPSAAPPEKALPKPAPAARPPAPAAAAVPNPVAAQSFDPYNSVRAESPPRPRPAASPPSPDQIPLVAWVSGFFTGSNAFVRSGIVVLFFGVAFLLKYAAEHSHVPIEFRLSGVALAAIVLLVLGWRLRQRREGYALALQGGGVGILYLTVFTALRLYHVLPPAAAFPLLVAIAALSAALAVLQNSQAFAMLGVIGGFLAPLLASNGEGSHVVLFSYFLVLNAGIVLIAWFKSWRPLNLCGFVFTFAIATAWGVLKYHPEDFASTEPFLIVFFLFYVGIAVLFALRQPLELRGYVDGTLVFGTPIAAFGLQTALLHQDSMALAYSATALSAVYLVLAYGLHRRRELKLGLLIECFLALGAVFLTLAIPLALGNRMNAAAWALEGAGLIWVGCRQGRPLARALGTLLECAAAVLLLREVTAQLNHWILPVGTYPAIVLVSVACLFSTSALGRAKQPLNELERLYAPLLFAVGLFSWCFGSVGELPHWVSGVTLLSASLAFLALTALLLSELARRVTLNYAAGSALLLLPAMCFLAVLYAIGADHPFSSAGWAAWPLSFAIFYLIAARHEGDWPSTTATLLHTFSLWLLSALLGWELSWQVSQAVGVNSSDWSEVSYAVVPGLVLLALPALLAHVEWPFAAHRDAYVGRAGLGLALVLALWTFVVNAHLPGNSAPLPYLPLLNPLDVVQMLVLLALLRFARLLREVAPEGSAVPRGFTASVLTLLSFVWLNGVLLRSLHHFLNIPYTFEALASSNLIETALSIFWSVLALITMLFASHRHIRAAWITGAGLLVIVVVKLFFVDLSNTGSLTRVISFTGVGLLMCIVGYFSPLPPRRAERS